MIIYDKLLQIFKERGMTTYFLQRSNLVGHATYTAMKNHTGGPDYKVLSRLCEVLQVQPGDLMEWIPDEEWQHRQEEKQSDE